MGPLPGGPLAHAAARAKQAAEGGDAEALRGKLPQWLADLARQRLEQAEAGNLLDEEAAGEVRDALGFMDETPFPMTPKDLAENPELQAHVAHVVSVLQDRLRGTGLAGAPPELRRELFDATGRVNGEAVGVLALLDMASNPGAVAGLARQPQVLDRIGEIVMLLQSTVNDATAGAASVIELFFDEAQEDPGFSALSEALSFLGQLQERRDDGLGGGGVWDGEARRLTGLMFLMLLRNLPRPGEEDLGG